MEYKNNIKIKSFTDLKVWQEAHKLVLLVYELTKSFPNQLLIAKDIGYLNKEIFEKTSKQSISVHKL